MTFSLFPSPSTPMPVLNRVRKLRPSCIAALSPIHRAHPHLRKLPKSTQVPKAAAAVSAPPRSLSGGSFPGQIPEGIQRPLFLPGHCHCAKHQSNPLQNLDDLHPTAQHEARITVPIFQMWEPGLTGVRGLAHSPCISHSAEKPAH